MEAGWSGTTLKLEGALLSVTLAGQPPVELSLDALTGFTLLTREAAGAARLAFGPGGALVVGWSEGRKRRALSIPVPSPALQVGFFLARLSQLRPGQDLQALPAEEALRKITPPRAPHLEPLVWILALLLAATLFTVVWLFF